MAFLQIDYKSEALMRGVNIKVILPSDGMAGKWEPPYKTLYLLPGYSATATELITYLGLRGQSELKGIAIVLPDGENLFYQDLPDRMTFYSTYVGKELVEVTRKMLPLSTKREDTFIGGISMGGYGALYNGFKYRDTFSKVVAFSLPMPACFWQGPRHLDFQEHSLRAFSETEKHTMEASVICVHSGQEKMWITDRNCFCAVEKMTVLYMMR
jgi:putative tributyrin esterase